MSTKAYRIHTNNPEATERIGERIGACVRGGEVIELVSDLGGGKTTFVRGLARGMGSTDRVSSPTFTLSREYAAGERTLYHFDLYRLNEAGLMADEVAELAGAPHAVTVIEWGDAVQHVLPKHTLRITIHVLGDIERELEISCPPELAYLTPKEVIA
ncbi:MAG TPA: tRNA (adenosine(37)-N6)-threonylcarbamoyltransferase complex ATPase subunit type 1 TsaE [Candidatus Saccharimonadales bacterium]|nr:tRNA (adenosine(37)-N6)-threonylcarbamoyltransferase complex ATPase subunit type 1 TsaE [Candidatus Saccharimonadales bacterium]